MIGANVVGLGALVGINRVAQDDTAPGSSTNICSPRFCEVGAPGEPCQCNTTVSGGGPCGQTASGVPIAGACSSPNQPCQAELSCNDGFYQERFAGVGACPF